jgi:gluconokinase
MGVIGAGKTTVGRRLANELGWDFVDADDFHPAGNVVKMSRGEPLTDEDRLPWLEAVRREIDERLSLGKPAVVACSALKRAYRRRLGTDRPEVALVHLAAGRSVIAERLSGRKNHFAGPELLESQFADLEAPGPDEALVVDAHARPERIVERIVATLVEPT